MLITEPKREDIVDMTNGSYRYTCKHCSSEIYNDSGWLLKDGTVVCRNFQRCYSLVIRKDNENKMSNGWVPPWRKQ